MDISNRALQLAQLFVSVLDPSALTPDIAERLEIVAEIKRWDPELTDETARQMIDTALQAHRTGLSAPIETLAENLCSQLSDDECLRLMGDLGRIARSDGHVSMVEARAIARARTVLGPGLSE